MTLENKRITTDVLKLMMNDFKVEMIKEDDMHAFFIQFHGPQESVYQGYMWKLSVAMPVDYPYEPPEICFVDSIYHPNIDDVSGAICLDVLYESWTPITDLVAVFERLIPQLLMYPNPDDPLNLEAADLLKNDPTSYETRVREYCEKYATLEKTDTEELDEDENREGSEDENREGSKDEMLTGTDEKTGNLEINEGKDGKASGGENVAGKSADP